MLTLWWLTAADRFVIQFRYFHSYCRVKETYWSSEQQASEVGRNRKLILVLQWLVDFDILPAVRLSGASAAMLTMGLDDVQSAMVP